MTLILELFELFRAAQVYILAKYIYCFLLSSTFSKTSHKGIVMIDMQYFDVHSLHQNCWLLPFQLSNSVFQQHRPSTLQIVLSKLISENKMECVLHLSTLPYGNCFLYIIHIHKYDVKNIGLLHLASHKHLGKTLL